MDDDQREAFGKGMHSWPLAQSNPYSDAKLIAAWNAGRLNAYTEAEWEHDIQTTPKPPRPSW